MAEPPYKYWAFISYSHQDRAWANWLHTSLETYRVPRRLVGREHWSGAVPNRLMPIFRDREDLSSSAELGTVLNDALRQSRYLIVICSPQSANSRWVNEEIRYFKSLGRSQYVLPLIVSGEPDGSSIPGKEAVECLPAAIRFEVDSSGDVTQRRAEPIAADARGGQDGRRNAKLKLIAGLIGVGLDELKQRERRRQILQRVSATAAVVTLTLLAGLGWRWQQAEKQSALEAQALKVRIEQLYENGRQELLAHNEARAAVYLNEAYRLGVDTPALRFMLARAMRVVDAQALRVQTDSAAMQAALSPDGKRFLTFGQDFKLKTWDAHTGNPLHQYALEADTTVVRARFSPSGKWIAIDTVGSSNDLLRLRVLDSVTGALIKDVKPGGTYRGTFAEPIDDQDRWVAYLKSDRSITVEEIGGSQHWQVSGQYSVARFCRDQKTLIAGTEHGDISLHEPLSGQRLRTFTRMQGAVVAVASNADCRAVAAGTDRGEVRLWNAASGAALLTGGHPQAIIDVQLDPAGSRLMSQTLGGINIWSGRNGALLYAAKFFDFDNIISAAGPQGEVLARISSSRLSITDPIRWHELYTLDGHLGAARNFSFGATDAQMISAGSDGSVILWRLPPRLDEAFHVDASTEASTVGPSTPVQAVFDHSGEAFFYGGKHGGAAMQGARQWHIAESDQDDTVDAAAFSSNDRLVAIGQRSPKITLRDARTGVLIDEWQAVGGRVRDLSFNASGDTLAAAIHGDALRAQLRRVPEGQVLADFDLDWPKGQALSPNGKTYAVGSRGIVRLWDIQKQAFLWAIRLPSGETNDAEISLLTFSPDGRFVLAAHPRRHAFLLNATDGKVLHTMDMPLAAGIYAAAVSPNGSVALGDFSKSVFLWKPASGQVDTLLGHTGEVRSVSFSPDGTLLLSAAADGAVRIWDVRRKELLETLTTHEGPVSWYNAAFNAQGDQALIGGTDGSAKLLDMAQERRDPDEIAALLRCRVAWRVADAELAPAPPETEGCPAR